MPPTKKKKVTGRKRGAVVPRALPAVLPKRAPRRARAAVSKAKKKAQELADREVKLSHVGAGVAGAGASMLTSSWLADREWLDWISPEWQSVVLTGLGATGSYVAYRHDKPHLSWGLGGWAAGTAYFGGISALSRAEYQKEVKQLAAVSSAQKPDKPRNAYAYAYDDDDDDDEPRNGFDQDDYEEARNAEIHELAESRIRELEEELAEARARLTPETELIAA